MSEHLSIERMNDLVDGRLASTDEARIRAHLETCAVCREDHAVLSETVAAMRALPGAARPPEHLWAGIAARIEGRSPGAADEGATVVPFPVDRTAPAGPSAPAAWTTRSARHRLTFSVPQLAAAAVTVALLSAGTMWAALRDGGVTGAATGVPSVVETSRPGAGPVIGAAARAANTSMDGYDQTISELQALVDAGRDVMRPETLRTLEESLAAIDQALVDVRDALEDDPSSELLMGMLVSHQTSKIRVLRRAATMIQSRS